MRPLKTIETKLKTEIPARKWQKQNWHLQIIKADRKDWGEGEKWMAIIIDQSKEIKPKKQNPEWIYYKEIENESEASVRNEGKKTGDRKRKKWKNGEDKWKWMAVRGGGGHLKQQIKNRIGGGRVVRRCCVSYITGASNWYWLTVGQGLLSL